MAVLTHWHEICSAWSCRIRCGQAISLRRAHPNFPERIMPWWYDRYERPDGTVVLVNQPHWFAARLRAWLGDMLIEHRETVHTGKVGRPGIQHSLILPPRVHFNDRVALLRGIDARNVDAAGRQHRRRAPQRANRLYGIDAAGREARRAAIKALRAPANASADSLREG